MRSLRPAATLSAVKVLPEPAGPISAMRSFESNFVALLNDILPPFLVTVIVESLSFIRR